MNKLKNIVKKIAPLHTPLGRKLKTYAASIGLANDIFFDGDYQKWITNSEPYLFLSPLTDKLEEVPLFSIVVPFYNTKEKYLAPLFESIVNQSYQNWEMIIGDGSSIKELSKNIKYYADQDPRIKYFKFTKDTDISGNTNQAIEMARGEYLVFCDHDDTLSKAALNEAAVVIRNKPDIDIVYSDEDKLTDNGKLRHSPYFKPGWSPHLFTYTNYTNHLSVVRRSLVEKVGGLRKAYNGSQDYDMLLRIHSSSEKQLKVYHIPKILYHWREAEGSTAIGHGEKTYASNAGKKALKEYFTAIGLKQTSIDCGSDGPGYYRVSIEPKTIHKIGVVVRVSDNHNENNSFIEHLKSKTITTLDVVYANIINKNELDAVVEINHTALPKDTNWLNELVGVLELPYTGKVSPRIIDSSESTVVDMGYCIGRNGILIQVHKNQGLSDLSIAGSSKRVKNVDKLSGAIVAYRLKKPTNKTYDVVWSPVDFVEYNIYGQSSCFNPNLRINNEDRITLL